MATAAGSTVRVLHLCPDPSYLRALFDLYRDALDKPPFESTVVFLRGAADSAPQLPSGGRVVFLDLPRGALDGLRLPALWRLWRWCRTRAVFDLVIAHRYKPLTLGLALQRLGHARQVFGVVHERGQLDGRRRWVITCAGKTPPTLIAVSDAVRVDLRQRFPGLPPQRVRTLPNAVRDYPQLPREAALAALQLAPQRFWFGSVGRLVPVKGHDLLLRAVAALARDLPQVGLALIGSGREEAALRGLCQELAIEDRVAFCGWREDARALLGAFDLCVFPSRDEGFGLAIAEAMAAGRPVIATAVGAVPELVGDVAALVPAGDLSALTAALRRLHDDAGLRRAMGEALRQRWQEHFSPWRFTERLQHLARDATGANP